MKRIHAGIATDQLARGLGQAVATDSKQAVVAATRSASARQFYKGTGTDPVVSTPGELTRFQTAESLKWGRIIKAAAIQPE